MVIDDYTYFLGLAVALGVIASVVPFNFPVMVPMWTLPIAIAMGKPSLLPRVSQKCALKEMPMTMTHSSISILLL